MKKHQYLILTALLTVSVISSHAQSSWTNLFDGKTLNGWKQATGKATYAVKNGEIIGTTVANSPNSFLVTEKEYGDFVLELEVKINDTTANSGIQFRSNYDPNGHE